MRSILALTFLCFTTIAAFAQDIAKDDRGVLQAFLEDRLSSTGRTVRIEGFTGALSSKATIETLSIADKNGVWLTLKGVVLDWSRAALLSGRLDVAELSAKEILLPRRPVSTTTPSAAEATPFALPDLPVSVKIGKFSAEKLEIGEAVLGAAATFKLDGSLSLADGEGAAKLKVKRSDGVEDALTLDAGYVNETRRLKLALNLSEGTGGIVSTLAKLPGTPALDLRVSGDAPISDFTATIALSSDGEKRLDGRVSVSEQQVGDAMQRQFSGDIVGDIAPIFAPDLRPFFGPEMRLSFSGIRKNDGRLELSDFGLSAASLKLNGSLYLAADGLPEKFDLSGDVTGDGPVMLPVGGPDTLVQEALIRASFDAEKGDGWALEADLKGFERAGLKLGQARITGHGAIDRAQPNRVDADLNISAAGISHDDPALASALGDALDVQTTLDWVQGAPLEVKTFTLRGAGLFLRADGQLDGLTDGFPAKGKMRLTSDDISRFSGVAKRPLSGAAALSLSGEGALLGGAFDVRLEGETTDLGTGVPQLDPLLKGRSTLRAAAHRDETGTTIDTLLVENAGARMRASGNLSGAAGAMALDLRLTEIAPLARGLSGPLDLSTTGSWKDGEPVQLDQLSLSAMDTRLSGSGTLDVNDATLPASGTVSIEASRLAAFSTLAGRSLHGALSVNASGNATLRGDDFDLSVSANGQDLAAGLGDFDKLIGGKSRLLLAATQQSGMLDISQFALTTPEVSAEIRGGVGGKNSLSFSAKLANLALITPEFPGPLAAQGTVKPVGRDWQVALDATGPGGTTARVTGRVGENAKSVDLALSGALPLGLANSFIAPRSVQGVAQYDLKMRGAPGLSAVSGSITTSGARVAAPTLGMALSDASATVTLSGESANVSVDAAVEGGGRVSLNGPINLSAPYVAGLEAVLRNVTLRDPELYETTVSGRISAKGPLKGAGQVSGVLELGPTEVSVPSSGAGPSGAIPDGIVHVGETAAQKATRGRAGLLASGGGGGTSASLGLDVTINAPSRIFVRGRGLDAELGGRLRLTGTTSNVVPIGRFDLIRGRLDILGKRLVLSEGQIRIQGAFDPYIRLVATAQADDTTLQIVTDGPVSQPQVNFLSQPELPQDEVISRLLFGRGVTTLSPLQAAQLASAVATLTGKGDGGIVAKLRQNFGLDDLDVSSTSEGETALKAGKYLSENIYTDVTVNSDGTSEINLNLDLSPQVTVKGGLGNDGDSSLGVFYEHDY